MFRKSAVKWSLRFLGLMILSGCGADNMRESSAELASETAPAMSHQICNGDEINVRNTTMAVIGTANTGDRMGITDQTKASNGNTFRRVFFYDDPKGWGWVAVQYICKSGAITNPTGPRVIEVNLSTNRLKFFKGGVLIKEWNVGTARAGKTTPKGNFQVKIKQVCPPYYGDGSKNIAGCSSENPLGTRALWFQGTIYGLHGTSMPWLLDEGTSANARRLSAGCIRNKNANIEWLFDQVQVGDAIVIK